MSTEVDTGAAADSDVHRGISAVVADGAPGAASVPHSGAAPGTPLDGASCARSTERAVCWLLAGLVALVAAAPISDNSLLTHIATGRLQVSDGLPAHNPFLITSSDFPVPSWWWSAALGWCERFLGLGGIRLLTALVAAALGWAMVRASRPLYPQISRGAPSGARIPAIPAPARTSLGQILPAAVVLALLVPFLNGRPHLPAFVLLAASLVLWRERRSPWWLVAVFAVWVNVHGSWLYGAAVLGLSWLVECIDDRRLCTERLRWALGILGGLVLGGVAYPQRFRLLFLPVEQMGSPQARDAMRLYAEWKSVSPGNPLIWVFAVVVVLALLGAWHRRSAGATVMVVVLTLLGISAFRMLPIAAITLAGYAALGVDSVSTLRLPGTRWRTAFTVVGMVALVGAGVRANIASHVQFERYPVSEVRWLDARGLVATPDVRLITNDYVGNYLEFIYGERAHTWVDDRPSAATMIDYVSLRQLGAGWQNAFRRADPDVVLWQRTDPLPARLARSDNWVRGHTTDDFEVLCRVGIAQRCR